MDRQPNPYRPGFNQSPGVLAGRDEALTAVREALEVAALDGRTPRPLVLVGTRGVGKTVLLGEIAAIAAELHGWLTVSVEIRPGTQLPWTAARSPRSRSRAAWRAHPGAGGSGWSG